MKKLRCKKGYTLIEMIVCVLTLVMIALICTTGFDMAMKSYNESLFESHSQMLESTINTYIGDILRYSHNAKNNEDDTVTFGNSVYGVEAASFKINEDGHFVFVMSPTSEGLLLGANVYAENLYVADFWLTYDSAVCTYRGGYTIKSTVTDKDRIVSFAYRSIVDGV